MAKITDTKKKVPKKKTQKSPKFQLTVDSLINEEREPPLQQQESVDKKESGDLDDALRALELESAGTKRSGDEALPGGDDSVRLPGDIGSAVGGDGVGDAIDDSREVVDESDSSEDEVAPRNTVGDVPLKWYDEEEHIGYDITGKKIKKKKRLDKVDSFVADADDPKRWRKIIDEYNDEEIHITKGEAGIVHKLLDGKAPHSDFEPYQPYVDWFKYEDHMHPLSNAPEPKRRFIPSKWEHKKVIKLLRAIRNGQIKFDKPKEEPQFFDLWGVETLDKASHGLAYIPAPKPKQPGHEESYNPSKEYIPTQEEINSYQLMFEEDRPSFIPRSYPSLRSVPANENAIREFFSHCLDLYLCPRVRKKRLNIDPELLKPKLPNPKDLKPYPTTCYLEYKGHKGAVTSISVEASGQWIVSGSSDGSVRIWEVETGRCVRVWELGQPVKYVAWNPSPKLPIIAVSLGHDVLIMNSGLGDEEQQKRIMELMSVTPTTSAEESENISSIVSWARDDKHEGVRLTHFKTVASVEWHRRGDYFSTVMPAGESRAVCIHQLSKKSSQKLPFKLHGLPVTSAFHPTRSIIFISTKKNVRVYDLVSQKLIKKLETGMREVSSIAIHPAGDNVIVGSREGKLCWFDMDLSSQPYKNLKCQSKDITNVAFHPSYPLFASSSDDGTAYVFHGMVYSDLNENPLIVPLRILRGHKNTNGSGVLDCKFHPRQPWLFTAGSDSVIKLYCH